MKKANGSIYVAVVVAVLAGYFTYMWWFNPQRAIKRQLGELAATLSLPAGAAGDVDRLERAARLRKYFAEDVRIRAGASSPDITSRDALLAAVSAWTPPPGGWNIDLVDLQVTLDTESAGRAYMTVEITTPDPRTGQPVLDAREMRVAVARRDGAWVITSAEPEETLQKN